LTCAVTGGAAITNKNVKIPVTPKEIADSAIAAAKAGAAIVHLHVRDPQTGAGSMDLDLYKETVDRVRDSGVDVLINLTTGNGAAFVPGRDEPSIGGPGTNFRPPAERVRHILALKPHLCSLDFNTMWFRTRAFINSPEHITEMARAIRSVGTVPELEVFDTGDIHLAKDLQASGVIAAPAYFQIVLGTKYGAVASAQTMIYMRDILPPGSHWASFGIGQHEYPMLAQSLILGGHVRVGLEDNYYLEKGVIAPSNAALVEKAVSLMRMMGAEPATPSEARAILGVTN
jgi:uncharacterized protein (DUF849 family)